MSAAAKTAPIDAAPSAKPAPILAFACDSETLDTVCRVVPGARRGVEVREGGIREAIAAVQHDGPPTLLVVDVSDSTDPSADMANLVSSRGATNLTVIAIGPENDISLYRSLIAAGATDYLVKPITKQELRRTILSISQADTELETRKTGDVIVTVGARGGIGTSSIAAGVASLLSHEFNRNVALVDLDLHFGTAALNFDVDPGNGLRSALEDPDRIDSLLVASALVKCGDSLYVLGGEEAIDEGFQVEPEAVGRLMEELRQVVDIVVIDMPRHQIANNVPFLKHVSAIAVVTDLSLAGLRDALRIRKGLNDALVEPNLVMVASRVGHAKAAEIAQAEFEKGMDAKIDFAVQETPQLAKAALDGKPSALGSQRTPAAQAMRALAKRLGNLEETDASPRRWLKLFRPR